MNHLLRRMAAATLLAAAMGVANAEDVSLNLTGAQEVPAVVDLGDGQRQDQHSRRQNRDRLRQDQGHRRTAAHIHEAPAGKNGPPIITLTKSGDEPGRFRKARSSRTRSTPASRPATCT